MPAILQPADYERWLGSEPDPHDLLITFPSEPMKMWPISKRVNSPRNDDEDLLAEIDIIVRGALGADEPSASTERRSSGYGPRLSPNGSASIAPPF
jgi:hypothetical protein